MSSPAKKQKFQSKKKTFFVKQGQNASRNFLKAGDTGFLVTYNFKEKESLREVFRLLNEFNSKKEEITSEEPETQADKNSDDDILDQLDTAIDKTKEEAKEKSHLFNPIEVGTNGSVFIKASPEIDVLELGTKILGHLAETKSRRTKFTNRLIPVEAVCKANLEDIIDNAGKLFDKYFLKSPSTFAINFNRRCNHDLSRDEVIKQLADLVTSKNIGNKVNLKNPEKSINLEVIKGLCLISVLPDYLKLKKYNLNELWSKKEDTVEESKNDEPSDEVSTQEVQSDTPNENNDNKTEEA